MFSRGVALGIAIAASVLFVLVAWDARGWHEMYKELGGAKLPALTQFAIGHTWLVVGPGLSAVACALLAWRRPTSAVPYIIVGVLVVAAASVTYYGARMPLWELAGNIK